MALLDGLRRSSSTCAFKATSMEKVAWTRYLVRLLLMRRYVRQGQLLLRLQLVYGMQRNENAHNEVFACLNKY